MEQSTKGNVLLLDDDKFLVEMYSLKFSKEGFNAQACLKATDAITALEGGFAADAVIFDILMPECDGFQFLQRLSEKKLAVNAVKVALTNQSNDEDRAHAISLGADLYLVKASMIPSDVVKAVGEAIAKKRS